VICLLFGWVVLRYALNPVRPGIAVGTGSAITGFRAYLNYGICLGIIATLPFFIRSRSDAVNLLRWLGVVALVFALIFIPLTLSKSLRFARVLTGLGLTPLFFDNGWLRFVSLPSYGVILLILSLLPRLWPLRGWQRYAIIGVAAVAIVMGGNRTSLAMAIVVVLSIAFVRRQTKFLAAAITGIAITLSVFYVLGENMKFDRGVGFFRVVSLVSPRGREIRGVPDTALAQAPLGAGHGGRQIETLDRNGLRRPQRHLRLRQHGRTRTEPGGNRCCLGVNSQRLSCRCTGFWNSVSLAVRIPADHPTLPACKKCHPAISPLTFASRAARIFVGDAFRIDGGALLWPGPELI